MELLTTTARIEECETKDKTRKYTRVLLELGNENFILYVPYAKEYELKYKIDRLMRGDK